MSEATKHTLFEDLQAIFTGALAVAVGVLFLNTAGLLTVNHKPGRCTGF